MTTSPAWMDRKAWIALGILLGAFLSLQCLLPLRTTVQICADEGFELAKATLCLKGHALYTEVWNDQPPLHTFLITQVLKHFTSSILGPRLVTTAFTLLLLASVFLISRRVSGLVVAVITTAMLIAAPGFLELSATCMLEIPALAPAIAGLCVLAIGFRNKWPLVEIVAGILFGISFEIKLVDVMLLPLAALLVWREHFNTPGSIKYMIRSLLLLSLSIGLSFVAIDIVIERGAFLSHFQQSWVSHFAAAKSFEYGSANDYPFDWRILLRNWDTTLPAILGIIFICKQARKNSLVIFPLAWLVLMLTVFSFHRPWWSYYYVHIAIPLCWCAAIGIEHLRQAATKGRNKLVWALLVAYGLCGAGWMGGRLYLEVTNVRNSPQTYSSLVLTELERYKPFTEWMYADQPVYSFHCGIPMPPDLAVVMLKRMWSGEMTNARIHEKMWDLKPGVVLLANDTRVVPFKDLLEAEYRLVYQDADLRLYALKTIIKKVEM